MKTARALLAVIAFAFAPELLADGAIDREITRLAATLDAVNETDLPADVRPLIAAHRASLGKAKAANPAEYQLYLLRDAFVGVETLSFLAKEKSSGESVETFEKLWRARRARFEAKPAAARGTLMQRGLAESATTRAERLFRASLPYAKASAPWSGVYYLGEAEGNLRFRAFVETLATDAGAVERTPSREGVRAMLEDLERAMLAFFAGDVTNRNAIPVSVRVKEARELLDAGRLAGAAFLAVEARAALSRRGGPRGAYPPHAAPPAGSMLSFLHGWADAEEAPMKEALRNEVAPFYGALFVAKGGPETKAARVTVTLVRWPYT